MSDLGSFCVPTPPLMLAGMPAGGQFITVVLWFAIAATLALGGFYVVVAVRRWVAREDTIDTFTIQDLRDMRNRGDISAQEFTAMRAKVLAQLELSATGAADEDLAPDPPPANDDNSEP